MALFKKTANQEELEKKSSNAIEDMIYIIRKQWYNNQLKPLGLTEDQIKTQNLEELKDSLERVNDALKSPELFGTVGVKFDFSLGAIISQNKNDATVEIGILPTLLETKKFIKDRMKLLEKETKIEKIQANIENVSEDESENIKQELEINKTEYNQLKQQIELEQKPQESIPDQIKIGIFERKAKVYQSFLEKESVATILGGFLLIVLTFAFLIASFYNITMSQIVANCFLLILGYFFGQASTKSNK